MDDSVAALLVAFAGSGVGAYFAIIKSQREKLWLDRYETLRDIVNCLQIIEARFSTSHLDQLGVSTLATPQEYSMLAEQAPAAMHNLRQLIAKVRLLFKEKQITALRQSILDLHDAIQNMNHGPDLHQPELNEAVAVKASGAMDQAIDLAQRHCVKGR